MRKRILVLLLFNDTEVIKIIYFHYTHVCFATFSITLLRERERERERERKENSSLLVATSLSEIRMYRLPARGAAAIFVFVVPENSKMARAVKVF